MRRSDYAFPFRIDSASRQGAAAPSYEAHVEQMIRQLLLTSPGERVNLPEFGCGLRRLLFAPNAEGLQSSTEILVRQGLGRWLKDQVKVLRVAVTASDDGSAIQVLVEYSLVETRTDKRLEVTVQ